VAKKKFYARDPGKPHDVLQDLTIEPKQNNSALTRKMGKRIKNFPGSHRDRVLREKEVEGGERNDVGQKGRPSSETDSA